jgi:hypothetical protein
LTSNAVVTNHDRRRRSFADRARIEAASRRTGERAKAVVPEIGSGRLGRLVPLHSMFWLLKPHDYFDLA